jgi:hypothetical protein
MLSRRRIGAIAASNCDRGLLRVTDRPLHRASAHPILVRSPFDFCRGRADLGHAPSVPVPDMDAVD